MDRTVDIVVIGAGPGGLSAAGALALHGREVSRRDRLRSLQT